MVFLKGWSIVRFFCFEYQPRLYYHNYWCTEMPISF